MNCYTIGPFTSIGFQDECNDSASVVGLTFIATLGLVFIGTGAKNIISRNVQINFKSNLFKNAQVGNLTGVKLCAIMGMDVNAIDQESNYTPLMVACKNGHAEVVRALLSKKDINVNLQNTKGQTAMHLACKNRDAVILVRLIMAGVDADIDLSEEESDNYFDAIFNYSGPPISL